MPSYDISSTQKAIVAYGTTIFSGGGSGPVDWAAITSKPSLYYTATFADARSIIINHNMKKYPAVRVIDTGGTEWYGGKITYTDLNNIKVEFSYLFAGTIYLA
jgi:hypothetical protein